MKFKRLIVALFVCWGSHLFAQDGGGIPFSFNDTLNKYNGLDTLIRANPIFYIGKVNSKPYGIIQIHDTSIIIFQKNKTTRFASQTFRVSNIANVKYVDLNEDGHKDVVIRQSNPDGEVNSEPVVLIYNSKTSLLAFRGKRGWSDK